MAPRPKICKENCRLQGSLPRTPRMCASGSATLSSVFVKAFLKEPLSHSTVDKLLTEPSKRNPPGHAKRAVCGERRKSKNRCTYPLAKLGQCEDGTASQCRPPEEQHRMGDGAWLGRARFDSDAGAA